VDGLDSLTPPAATSLPGKGQGSGVAAALHLPAGEAGEREGERLVTEPNNLPPQASPSRFTSGDRVSSWRRRQDYAT